MQARVRSPSSTTPVRTAAAMAAIWISETQSPWRVYRATFHPADARTSTLYQAAPFTRQNLQPTLDQATRR